MSDPISMGMQGAGLVGDILNFGFGLENQAYQRNLQQTIFDREDSAWQRKVADMKKANINPIYAAGGAGSASGAISGSQVPQAKVDNALAAITMMRGKADIDQTKAQTELLNAQKDKTLLDNEFKRESNPLTLGAQRYALQYDQETLRDRITNTHNTIGLQELEARNRELDAQLKEVKVPREKVELAIRLIDQASETLYGVKRVELEFEAKKLAIEMQKKENAEKNHNLDWFGSRDLPTNARISPKMEALKKGSVGRFFADVWGME